MNSCALISFDVVDDQTIESCCYNCDHFTAATSIFSSADYCHVWSIFIKKKCGVYQASVCVCTFKFVFSVCTIINS